MSREIHATIDVTPRRAALRVFTLCLAILLGTVAGTATLPLWHITRPWNRAAIAKCNAADAQARAGHPPPGMWWGYTDESEEGMFCDWDLDLDRIHCVCHVGTKGRTP